MKSISLLKKIKLIKMMLKYLLIKQKIVYLMPLIILKMGKMQI